LEDSTTTLRTLVSGMRFEVLPLQGALARASRLPPGSQIAITADPDQGMEPTIELAVALAQAGFDVIPHLAAQMISDRADLVGVVERLEAVGIDSALVVGGVSDTPGEYSTAHELLEAIVDLDGPLQVFGIGGYPEGHHVIPDAAIDEAMEDKAPRAAWITTQICFDVERLEEWIRRQQAAGINVPIWVGVPGVADLTGLMSLGMRIGAGRSLDFMFQHPRLVTRLLRPGGRKASQLVQQIGELATDPELNIAGLHVFTYNQIRAAQRWRQGLLRRAR
jgi:methylenetetrahydrofolate reductase (NADPH)